MLYEKRTRPYVERPTESLISVIRDIVDELEARRVTFGSPEQLRKCRFINNEAAKPDSQLREEQYDVGTAMSRMGGSAFFYLGEFILRADTQNLRRIYGTFEPEWNHYLKVAHGWR